MNTPAVMKYLVICRRPDGGDVIEGRRPPYRKQHASLKEAIEDMVGWHRAGPNGPVRRAQLYRIGEETRELCPWEEIERAGMVPLVRKDHWERQRLAGCEPR